MFNVHFKSIQAPSATKLVPKHEVVPVLSNKWGIANEAAKICVCVCVCTEYSKTNSFKPEQWFFWVCKAISAEATQSCGLVPLTEKAYKRVNQMWTVCTPWCWQVWILFCDSTSGDRLYSSFPITPQPPPPNPSPVLIFYTVWKFTWFLQVPQ
jgi:hypothetical protein